MLQSPPLMLAAVLLTAAPAIGWAQTEGAVACDHASPRTSYDAVVATCVLGLVALGAVWWRMRRRNKEMDLGTSVVAFVLGMEMGEWLLRAVHSLQPHLVAGEDPGDAQRRWSVMIAFIFVALIVSHLWERSAGPKTEGPKTEGPKTAEPAAPS